MQLERLKMHFAGVSGGGVAAVAAAVVDPLAGSLAAAPVLTPPHSPPLSHLPLHTRS